MIRSLACTAFASSLVTIAAPAMAQDVEGYWAGSLDVNGVQLPVGIALARGEDDTLSGTLDTPSQGGFDIPLTEVTLDGTRLSFAVPRIGASYAGEWNAVDGTWDGQFIQGGLRLPLVLAASTPPERPETPEPEPLPENWEMPSDDAIASIISERIAERPGAGMVVGVIDGGDMRTVAAGGEQFDGDTIFEIGSMTKVFTSLLLAQMALDGTVSLDDPVTDYLPEGATMPSRGGRQITLRNLSQQDSGLPRLPDNLVPTDISDPYADYGEADLLAFLAGYELPRDIGSEYEYSNLGIGLLGYVLARAEDTDFASLLFRRILEPLGMSDTGIALTDAHQARFATPHDGYMRPTSPWDLGILVAGGGMRSTAADMQKFLAAALDSASPIAAPTALMLSETRETPGNTVGLGWGIRPTPMGDIVAHGGGTGGFRSYMSMQPDTGHAVVVLTNAAVEPSARDIGLHVLVGDRLDEAGPVPEAPGEISRDEAELTDAELARVVGVYRFAPGMDMTITREGDQLMAAITGQGALPIYPRGPLQFFYRAVNAEIVFAEEDGAITGATFTQDGASSPLMRVD